jgi:hypothetical protein
MKSSVVMLISAAVAVTIGAAYFLDARGTRDADPIPAPAPQALASFTPPAERTSSAEDIQRPGARTQKLALEIERALVSSDPRQREIAFNFLLPELIETEPGRVIAMVARQEPGEARDALRDEVTRQWITQDRAAAIAWMGTFENEAERQASATIAMRTLAAIQPASAIAVADQFGIGRNDGSLEHIAQIWATENFDDAMRWLETQPDDQRTAQLRARMEHVRAP